MKCKCGREPFRGRSLVIPMLVRRDFDEDVVRVSIEQSAADPTCESCAIERLLALAELKQGQAN